MNKPTPGPWSIENENGSFKVFAKEPTGCDEDDDVYNIVCHMPVSYGVNSCAWASEPNAHLISAAPDLLEACELALSAFENNNCIDWGVLEKAIAKARNGL